LDCWFKVVVNFSDNSLNINVTFNALYIIKIGKK
ncbi:hypothetical protein, partial [Staphylococcus aureus]